MKRRSLTLPSLCLMLFLIACGGGQNTESGGEALTLSPPAPQATPATDPAFVPSETPDGSTTDPGEVDEMPVEVRLASIEAVTDFFGSLPGDGGDGDTAAIIAYLDSRPEFRSSGVSDDGTVWAEFSDGRLLVVFDNRDLDDGIGAEQQGAEQDRPDAVPSWTGAAGIANKDTGAGSSGKPSSAVQAQSTSGALPESDTAYVLNGMGTAFNDATPRLEGWLSQRGYQVNNASPTVEMLKTVSNAGLFYLGSHGGRLADFHGNAAFAIWTATPIDAFNETLLRLDIEAGRVVYAVARHDLDPGYDAELDSPGEQATKAANYAITAEFVKEYMSFGPNSFVYIDACSSGVPVLRDAFVDKGASLYVGWDTPVGDNFANKATLFLFDRMMGANGDVQPPYPKQRPFDYLAVKENMGRENLLVEADGTTLTFNQGRGNFGLLMPSIAYLEVHEASDELFIYGMFGDEPGKVTIGEKELDPSNWTPQMVAVKLADTGEGSAGEVLVSVRDHESNKVPLTEWRGEIRYSANADTMAPNLLTTVVIDAHFRADIHPYRIKPGEAPVERQVTFVLAGDSTAQWLMAGSSTAGGTTFEISGSGELPLSDEEADHELAHFSLSGTLVPQEMLAGVPPVIEELTLHLHLSSDSEGTLRMIIPGVGTQESGFPINQTDVLYDQAFQMDDSVNIQPGERRTLTMRGGPSIGEGILSWDALKANHAPNLGDLPHAAAPQEERRGPG